METIYNVDYFIKKFEAIDDNKWTTGSLKLGDKHCAAGHCGLICESGYIETAESRALLGLFQTLVRHNLYEPVLNINDGLDAKYQQRTAKKRILAALYDIRSKQQPEVKERIVYKTVTVDEKVRELQKAELSLS